MVVEDIFTGSVFNGDERVGLGDIKGVRKKERKLRFRPSLASCFNDPDCFVCSLGT